MKIRSATVPGAVLCVLFLGSCEPGGGEILPPDYNAKYTRSFVADLAIKKTAVKAFAGVDGSPVGAGGKPDLSAAWHGDGVRFAAVPRGTDCGATLDKVFPNAGLPATDSAGYQFGPLDKVIQPLVKRGIPVIWQAVWDVGEGACSIAPNGGDQASYKVNDPDLWAAVSIGVLQHLKSAGTLPAYVEFMPDAFGAGGYDAKIDLDRVQVLHSKLVQGLRHEFPEDPASKKKPFQILSPSITVPDEAEVERSGSPIATFITRMKDTASDQPDVFAYQGQGTRPEDILAVARSVRAALKGAGLAKLPVADVGPRPSPDLWEGLSKTLDTVQRRSAYYGTFLAASKILLQDELVLVLADRWAGPRTGTARVGEDLFVGSDDTPLPALHSILGFYLMEVAGAVRVETTIKDGTVPGDGKGVVAMTALSQDGKKVFVMVAAADPDLLGTKLKYQVDVGGVGAWAVSASASRAVVDAGTLSFHYSDVKDVPIAAGHMIVSGDIGVPSLHYVEITLEGTPAVTPDAIDVPKDAPTAG
jgi:hypothetical protein